MDATLLLTGGALLIGSVILSFGIERIIRRLNAGPAKPADRSAGFVDVIRHIGHWQQRKQEERNGRNPARTPERES